jgi:hypothetical protein
MLAATITATAANPINLLNILVIALPPYNEN